MVALRHIPPTAGYPIGISDLMAWRASGSLSEDMRELLGVPYARITCSGTVAFYVTLQAIRGLTTKRTLIIPAFICPLVGLAIVRAGFKIIVCDIAANGQIDYDMNQLKHVCESTPDAAAIVIAHLGGMPADLDAIRAITQPHGLMLIEDCAQALGAEYKGKKVGTIGDFAFFSFARGKGMTLYEGGVLVSKHGEFAVLLDSAYEQHVPKNRFAELGALSGLLGYALFYRPSLFWFIFDSTYIFWNRLGDEVRAAAEYNRLEFPIYQISAFRQRLGHAFFRRLRPQVVRQWESAQRYFNLFRHAVDFRCIEELPDTRATYPYVVLVFPDRTSRDMALKAIRAEGLGAFIIYIRALEDYDYMKPYLPEVKAPNARRFAEYSLTLSTNLYLREKDRARIAKLLGVIHA